MNSVLSLYKLFRKLSLGKLCVHSEVQYLKRLAWRRVVWFEVVETFVVKINVSLDVTPYSLVERYLRNFGAYISNYTESRPGTWQYAVPSFGGIFLAGQVIDWLFSYLVTIFKVQRFHAGPHTRKIWSVCGRQRLSSVQMYCSLAWLSRTMIILLGLLLLLANYLTTLALTQTM